MYTEKSFKKAEEDDRLITYHPIEPIRILNCALEPSECALGFSKKLSWAEILPILTDYLEWLAVCEDEVRRYLASKSGEVLSKDWFQDLEVYSADITFLTLEDYGATITIGESFFPDHSIELEFDKKEITDALLIG